MSIAEKIKELQTVQAKIELYERLAGNIAEEVLESPNEGDDVDLLKEFASEVVQFAKGRIGELNGVNSPKVAQFKQLQPEVVQEEPVNSPKERPPEDPLTFALRWRRNEGKEVSFETKDGIIQGHVRGVNPPNIVVETTTGITITVPPTELTIKGDK